MEKNNKNLKLAIKQIINATWILRYEIPDDGINRTRKMIGEAPEVVVREHIRDDRYYNATNIRYYIEEGDERIAKTLVIEVMRKGGNSQDLPLKKERHPIRNQKNIFEYNYASPIDKKLEEHRKNVED